MRKHGGPIRMCPTFADGLMRHRILTVFVGGARWLMPSDSLRSSPGRGRNRRPCRVVVATAEFGRHHDPEEALIEADLSYMTIVRRLVTAGSQGIRTTTGHLCMRRMRRKTGMTDDIRDKVADAIFEQLDIQFDVMPPVINTAIIADAAIAAYHQARRIETVEQLDALSNSRSYWETRPTAYQLDGDTTSGLYGPWMPTGAGACLVR